MKNNVLLLGICTLMVSLFSCTKSIEEGNSNGTLSTVRRSAGDNQYDLLGYGYDVTGRFANSESAKFPVIDIGKFIAENPSDYDVNVNVEQFFDYYVGGDALDYSSSLSQKYNLSATIKKFKGEVNVAFNSSNSFSSKYAYASGYMKIKQKRLRIFALAENLRNNYLTQSFKSDLNNLAPNQLIDKYGTHVLTNITLGAKLDINYRTETSNTNRKRAAQVGLSINGALKIFGMDIGAGLSGDVNTDRQEASSNFNQTLFYRTVGGDGTKGLIGTINLDNSAPQLSIANWQSSCTRDNAALIEIDPNGIIPLEDLIADPTKKTEIKNYIDQYLLANQVTITYERYPIYMLYSNSITDHVYSPDPNAQSQWPGWVNYGAAFYAYLTQVPGTVPIYVLYSDQLKDHVYSPDPNAQSQWPGWVNYGAAFYAYSTQVPGTVPIYLLYSDSLKDHVYSPNPNAQSQWPGWVNYGPAFYAFLTR